MLRALRIHQPPVAFVDRLAKRAARHWILVVLAFGAVLFLPALGERPFRFEEGNRAAQAFAMLHDGAWWRLQIFDQPYLNKPPLLPWLIALIGALTGSVGEWAVRLPPVLFTLFGAVAAGFSARRLAGGDRLAALAAGLFYFGCGFIFIKARVGETDTLVTASCGAALAIWMARGGLERRDWFGLDPLGFTGVLIAFAATWLAKGPIPLLFPLVPMILTPLVERRPKPIAGLLLLFLASGLPVLLWLWLNRDILSAHRVAAQMRIAEGEQAWGAAFSPGVLLAGVANLLPGGGLALIGWQAARRDRSQPGRAAAWQAACVLALAIVPAALVVLLWPGGRGRYAMPAAWPMAVMAGIATARYWPNNRLVGGLACGTAIVILCLSLGLNLGVDGRSAGQRLNRQRGEALAAALADLPPGRIFLLDPSPDANVLVYGGRALTRVALVSEACGPAAALLTTPLLVEAAEATGGWQSPLPVGDGWRVLLQPSGSGSCTG